MSRPMTTSTTTDLILYKVCGTTRLLLLALTAFYVIGLAVPACPPTNASDAIIYVPINETLYDRNYSTITSGKNPLGFYSSIWYYNQMQPSPCIKLTAPDSSSTSLEIMFETVPQAKLCIQVAGQQGSSCQIGRGSVCGPVSVGGSRTIHVQFYCDEQCEQADVNFWYRLVLMPAGESLDTWCSNNRNSKFPSDLITLPQDMTLPKYTTPKPRGTGTACRTLSSQFLLLPAVWFTIVLLLRRF